LASVSPFPQARLRLLSRTHTPPLLRVLSLSPASSPAAPPLVTPWTWSRGRSTPQRSLMLPPLHLPAPSSPSRRRDLLPHVLAGGEDRFDPLSDFLATNRRPATRRSRTMKATKRRAQSLVPSSVTPSSSSNFVHRPRSRAMARSGHPLVEFCGPAQPKRHRRLRCREGLPHPIRGHQRRRRRRGAVARPSVQVPAPRHQVAAVQETCATRGRQLGA
jgi:hypothetical protein